jgi:hypothetical protein
MTSFIAALIMAINPTTQPVVSTPEPELGYYCGSCEHWHAGPLMDFTSKLPDPIAELSQAQRDKQVVDDGPFKILRNDQGIHYFIRAVLEIPVQGMDKPFAYGMWVSLSEASYRRAKEVYFDEQASEAQEPFFAWTMNRLEDWPDTYAMKATIQLRAQHRPLVSLEPTDHPLSVASYEGMSRERLMELVGKHMVPKPQ